MVQIFFLIGFVDHFLIQKSHHFYNFWICEFLNIFYNFWIQKSHHFYVFLDSEFFGPFSQFLDRETAVFLQCLDPEIAPFLKLLDCQCKIVHSPVRWSVRKFPTNGILSPTPSLSAKACEEDGKSLGLIVAARSLLYDNVC